MPNKYANYTLEIFILFLSLILPACRSDNFSNQFTAPAPVISSAAASAPASADSTGTAPLSEISFHTGPAARPVHTAPSLTELWAFDTGGSVRARPLISNETIYVATRAGTLLALNLETGVEKWRYTPQEGIWARSPVLAGSSLIIVGLPGQLLVGLDTKTGREIWRATLTGDAQRPPRVAGDTLYVGTTFVGPGLPSNPEQKAWLYALDTATGQERWSLETDNYLIVTPAIFNNTLYAGGSYYDPGQDVLEGGPMRIYALNSDTGQVQWITEGDAGLIKRLEADSARLYYLGYQDKLFALNAATGRPDWTYDTENWTPNFTISGHILYFGSANAFMHALDTGTGQSLWKFNIEGSFNFPLDAPQQVSDTLYFQTVRSQFYALDANSGNLLWQTQHNISNWVPPVIAADKIYIAGRDGVLHAFALPG
ncbi:MAG: PQQ-binding-like beta-propeller repeat protein [Anaerolineae bacterium]